MLSKSNRGSCLHRAYSLEKGTEKSNNHTNLTTATTMGVLKGDTYRAMQIPTGNSI